MNAENFKSLKKNLFSELYKFDNPVKVPKKFEEEFLKLIEKVILSLMEGENNFFALFIIQMKREVKMDLETAVASKPEGTHYTLYFNPWIFLDCSLKEMQALLKHEVYHILNLHHIRARELSRKYSTTAVNVAMDIAVNQYIMNLPAWSERLEFAKLSYNADLREEMTMEQYAHLLQEAMNKLKRDRNSKTETIGEEGEQIDAEKREQIRHNIEAAHDIWYEEESNIDKEQMKETAKKMADNASKGKIPGSVEELVRNLNRKAQIGWNDYLKRLMGALPSGYKKTITRKNRRQPERLDLRGRLSTHTVEIVTAIDISGSVTDKEIQNIMTEILSIVKNYKHKLTVIECDSEIRRVYEAKSMRDIRKKLNTRGSTKFTPVFKFLKDAGKRNCMLIYFTDGLGEAELECIPYHHRTLWVLTGKEEKLSLSKPYGVVKRLDYSKTETDGTLPLELLKLEMKEIRSEWAK